jgi:hypothetical protein
MEVTVHTSKPASVLPEYISVKRKLLGNKRDKNDESINGIEDEKASERLTCPRVEAIGPSAKQEPTARIPKGAFST